jgi:hypothetical protein
VSDWMDDPALTNIYDFYRNVQSGYVIFSHLGRLFKNLCQIKKMFKFDI